MLRALSLYQPWASLVTHGLKEYETRSWAASHRGMLAIQAARKWTTNEQGAAHRLGEGLPDEVRADLFDERLRGYVLCVVELVACEPTEVVVQRIAEDERQRGDYSSGRYAYRLVRVQRLVHPVPVRGRMRIWQLTEQEEAGVRASLPG